MQYPHTFFDSHLHIIDPAFPLMENNGYLPEPFLVRDYSESTKNYNLVGGAIVSGSFQAFDQAYLLAALKQLGPSFVGVTQLPATVSDADIISLNSAGIRAVRFNLKRGGSESLEKLSYFASRVFELVGWHVELYVDAKELDELYSTLVQLPKISIDHLGLSFAGFNSLLKLVEAGCHVKATGFGRVDFDVSNGLKQIYKINPDALMFGTDLPSTRAPRPFGHQDIELIDRTFSELEAARVFYKNALAFYARN